MVLIPKRGISSRAVGDKNLSAGYQKWGISSRAPRDKSPPGVLIAAQLGIINLVMWQSDSETNGVVAV